MGKGRVEAFSDGVIAIIVTVMVLEFKVPAGSDLAALRSVLPTFLTYLLSFIYVSIYWNNHHHLLHIARGVDGRVMWANLHLLFWLSLAPFVTAWVGRNPGQGWPSALYALVLLMAGVAYRILLLACLAHDGPDSKLAHAVGRDVKGIASLILYASSIGLSFVFTPAAYAIFVVVALMWLVPDRRIERELRHRAE